MHKHKAGIRVHLPERVHRENMVRTLEHPSAFAALMLQMLEETLMETVRLQMPLPVEPLLIGWDVVGGVEAQASKHVSGDFNTLLRRPRIERMQECIEITGHVFRSLRFDTT